ncbi:ketoacyl-ACP synthase III [bacterium]|nr:ketoacyl-ACP synthase III [bacterium]
MKKLKISGTGTCFPEYLLSSRELEQKYALPEGWCMRYSGVESRYRVIHESGGELGAKAVERAIEDAGLSLSDIDLLISASATFDYPLPNQACVIKSKLKDGSKYDFPAISVDSTCTGFLTALDLAAGMLDGVKYGNIVIINSEDSSKGLNPDNWETLSLFGDAAVASLVSYTEEDLGIIKSHAITVAEGMELTIIRGGGNVNHPKDHPYDPELYSFSMSGKALLRMAKKYIEPFMEDLFRESGYSMGAMEHVLPHQASLSGLNSFKSMYKLSEEQVHSNLKEFGNCISASIPLLLHQGLKSGRIKRGETCLLAGTSAGFSISGLILKV